MSLCTDKFFYNAIKGASEIADAVQARIYNPAVPTPDEKLDTVAVPYIVIMNDGTVNHRDMKDETAEGDTDTDTVSVLVVAKTRDDLAVLAQEVRAVVKQQMVDVFVDNNTDGYNFTIDDYTFSAGEVQMDVYKPCVWQRLTYVCETTNHF